MYGFQRLLATIVAGDRHHLFRRQAMVLAEDWQQALHGFQRLFAADIVGDGHYLVRRQAMVLAQPR